MLFLGSNLLFKYFGSFICNDKTYKNNKRFKDKLWPRECHFVLRPLGGAVSPIRILRNYWPENWTCHSSASILKNGHEGMHKLVICMCSCFIIVINYFFSHLTFIQHEDSTIKFWIAVTLCTRPVHSRFNLVCHYPSARLISVPGEISRHAHTVCVYRSSVTSPRTCSVSERLWPPEVDHSGSYYVRRF